MQLTVFDWLVLAMLPSLLAFSATTKLRMALYLNSAERIKHALEWHSQTPTPTDNPKPQLPPAPPTNNPFRRPASSNPTANATKAAETRRRARPAPRNRTAERRRRIRRPSPAPFNRTANARRRRRIPTKTIVNTTKPAAAPFGTSIPVKWTQWRYQVEFAIGTPPLPITSIFDTGSDLIWTQCQPCTRCEPQSSPIYEPRRSSSFSLLPSAAPLCVGLDHNRSVTDRCDFYYGYGGAKSWTRGVLANETITFTDGSAFGGFAFGCGSNNFGNLSTTTGIAGFGQGNLSMVSQLKLDKFSYCLASANSNLTGRLLLGSRAVLEGSAGEVQTTPLLNERYFYRLSMWGISLGGDLLPIPSQVFEKMPDKVYSGTTIDSGAVTMLLPMTAYVVIVQRLLNLVALPVVENTELNLSICFLAETWPPARLPDMTFHFERANMTIPAENYMFFDEKDEMFCLMMEPAPKNANFTNIGNYQMQNMHMLYDLRERKLSFMPAQCDQL